MPDQQAAMRARIEHLAARFLLRCRADMAAARLLLGRLQSGDLDALQELEQSAHRIVGTGASLGFDSLSSVARAIERLAEAQARQGCADDRVLQRLTAYVAELESEVERLAQARV